MLAEAVFELLGEGFLNFDVALADRGGVEEEKFFVVFEVFKARPVAEGEIDFVTVPELKGDDFVALFSQDADGAQQRGGIVEEVADENDQAPGLGALGEGFDVLVSLKNALDQAYVEWNRKPAAIVAYGATGGAFATGHLRDIAIELQMVNVRAPFFCARKVADHMAVGGGGGAILNIVSIDGVHAAPGEAIYGSAKAALVSLT